jgi:7,8-dihydropterin-6-yl-methyl-4-(beta-D-ribofuranosyl)aminobenzene 5'-phosphate synthase
LSSEQQAACSKEDEMKITVVYDNEVAERGLEADWGFSCLIEGDGVPPILFDTGANGSILLRNMERLRLDPRDIATVVISHGHFDHTGGLPAFLGVNSDAEIYVPASFSPSSPVRKVRRVRESVSICASVHSPGELGGVEQSLVVDTDGGVVVVTGCSHPGVGAIIDAASDYGKVCGIIGGFHGFRDFRRLEGLSLICPCHCTQYKAEISRLFPGQCVKCGAGQVLEV